jgi:hypothetical protein
MQYEVDQSFVSFFANVLDEGVRSERFAHLERNQSIFSERKVKVLDDWQGVHRESRHEGREHTYVLLLPSTSSCSEIFARSEPPTKPMMAVLRKSRSNLIMSGEAFYTTTKVSALGKMPDGFCCIT